MGSIEMEVARILYKEIVEGDVRKTRAESNDSSTGGGARDFRFGSYPHLLPIIEKMFPEVVMESRRRGGSVIQCPLYKGTFHWLHKDTNKEMQQAAFFEPPTDARPTEGRITRVHEYPCFDASDLRFTGDNRIVLLFVQRQNGTVWPHYVEEKSLRRPDDWHPDIAREIVGCLDARRAANQAAIGFRDFTTSGGYCNGK